jgi:hypothetical protein
VRLGRIVDDPFKGEVQVGSAPAAS